MKPIRHIILLLLAGIFVISCNRPAHYVTLTGKFNHFDTDSIAVCTFSYHNSPNNFKEYKSALHEDASFKLRVPVDTATVMFLDIAHTHYPVYVEPGQKITLSLDQDTYPKSVKVHANNSPLNSQYNNSYQYYQFQDQKVQAAIDSALPDFLKGDANEILKLEKLRIRIAMEDFSNTPFDIYAFKAMGDYIIRSLENINNQKFKNAVALENDRDKLLDEADDMGFFTIHSLVAQQEKLADFINEFMLSYKIESSRYADLNSKLYNDSKENSNTNKSIYQAATTDLLEHITSKKAREYLSRCLNSHQNDSTALLKNREKQFEEFVSRFSNHSSYVNYLQMMIGKEKN